MAMLILVEVQQLNPSDDQAINLQRN